MTRRWMVVPIGIAQFTYKTVHNLVSKFQNCYNYDLYDV